MNSGAQSIKMAVKQLVDESPKLHGADDPASEYGLDFWGIQSSVLELFMEMVTPGCLTLETGCGLSTICFAVIGSEHICVSPDPKEHNRIRHFCTTHHISTKGVRFIAMKSEAALPSLDIGGRKLDFALIDGCHAFPTPMIDYYYLNERLKIGGFLFVDDLHISTVGFLHKFLITEPAYEFVRIDSQKTGIYRKVGITHYPNDWFDQKLNSKCPDRSFLPLQVRAGDKLQSIKMNSRASLARIPGLRRAFRLLMGRNR